MENNIPTLYILELDSFAVKSAKISTILIFYALLSKKNNRVFVLPTDLNNMDSARQPNKWSQNDAIAAMFWC